MKKLITLLLIAFSTIANAQIHNPVKWKTAVEKINDNEYYLVATASIEAGWKLYGQNIPPNGPVPTSFKYTQDPIFELVGKTEESKPIVKHGKVFDMEIAYFYRQAVFKQRVKLLGEVTSISIKAEVEFMSCDDSNCLPPDSVDLEFFLSGTATANQGATPQFTFGNNTDANNTVPATTVSQTTPKVPATTPISHQGLWTIFFISFLSGFAALLTPCVFPMIPMTVSYFTKQSKTKAKGIKNAVIYGISIIVIYVLLGSAITLCAYILWQMSTHGLLTQNEFLQILKEDATLNGLVKATLAITGSNIIAGAVKLFSTLALVTSFLGVGLGLLECIEDLLKRSFNISAGRISLGLMTFIPPLVFALFYPEGFILALGYAGQMFAFYAVVLPVSLVWKARRTHTNLPYKVWGGNLTLIIVLVLGVIITSIPFAIRAGYLPFVVG